jgi:pimeloyl-ACP methyl ester carboxylesterase
MRPLLGIAAGAFDRAVVRAMELRNARVRRPAEALPHAERMERLAQIEASYRGATFEAPPPIAPRLTHVRDEAHAVAVIDARWESRYEPHAPGVRDAYLAHEENRTAHARLFLGREPRPAVVLLHGYMAGQWRVEERAWPIAWMLRRGLDVAIVVLPFHALRGRPGRAAPPFPGADPRFSNEGFLQAMRDIRGLIAFLRARGAPRVGAMGMSLGGYTTALLAAVEPELGFAVPIIPLASIADFARDQGRLGTTEQARLQHAALEAANGIVNPLARPPLVARERLLVIGAEADAITPIAHAQRIAAHWGAPLVRIHGGHLLQFGRGDAFRAVGRMLRETGVV